VSLGSGHTLRTRTGLRSRLTAAFAVGALLLSGLIAVLSYTFARGYLIDQRGRSAERLATAHAKTVQAALSSADAGLQDVLDGLQSTGSQALIDTGDRWILSSSTAQPTDIPAGLRADVRSSGEAVRQRISLHGRPLMVAGVPLPQVDATYYEITPLSELNRTLRTIRTTLFLVALGAAIGAGLLGRWVSGRLLQPLERVAATSRTIAQGDLAARLPDTQDRQLALLTTSFNDMAESLAKRIERDARFAADVSHELRSPLTTLTTSLAVLQGRRSELSPRSAEALDLLAGEVERFRHLVEDLLDISRADAGVVDSREPVVLSELLHRLVEAHSDWLNRPVSAALRIDGDAGGIPVLADKRRLVRVFVNLLENGFRHGGGVTTVRLWREGDQLAVAIDDAGPGVSTQDRERVFERFSRAAASGRRQEFGGTGLGLALVREHVRAHDGTVLVEAAPSGGARFVVRLPVAALDSPAGIAQMSGSPA
jgi:two-component system, OmpR family, sensor histidine kinase MtrB